MSTATAVRERPIIMQPESVRAILDGRKTVTRRVVKPQPLHIEWFAHQNGWCAKVANKQPGQPDYEMVRCPYGAPGDRLWVRETWAEEQEDPNDGTPHTYRWVHYRATPHHGIRVAPTFARMVYLHESAEPERIAAHVASFRWKSPRFMPRWASRITLEVVSVRVERLQEITEEDAIAEGVRSITLPLATAHGTTLHYIGEWPSATNGATARDAFALGWNSLNAARGHGWDANPWVWVVEFRLAPSSPESGT